MAIGVLQVIEQELFKAKLYVRTVNKFIAESQASDYLKNCESFKEVIDKLENNDWLNEGYTYILDINSHLRIEFTKDNMWILRTYIS